MQTNAVLIVQKTSKGDMSGNTAYTSLGSTCIISTGEKITVKSPLRDQSPEPRLSLLNAYLALSTIYTMLPFNCRLLWDCYKVLYTYPCSFLLPCMYISPAVLLPCSNRSQCPLFLSIFLHPISRST